MISDEDAKQMFLDAYSILEKHGNNRMLANQLYRGSNGPYNWENRHPGGCKRHLMVFNEFNIIPEFCFNCYKVVIEPRTVMELFKLVLIFLRHELPNDNVRKCLAEGREQVSGLYKGMIYCLGIDEGEKTLAILKDLVSKEISSDIPVTLKRGCSEYALNYPEFSQVKQGRKAMEYKKEWQKYEDSTDQKMSFNAQTNMKASYNHPGYSLRDAEAMFAWLRYAATIGDLSYLKISDYRLDPYQNLKRPTPFHPVENE